MLRLSYSFERTTSDHIIRIIEEKSLTKVVFIFHLDGVNFIQDSPQNNVIS